MEWLLGLSSDHEGVLALATIALVFVTLLLVVVASRQISAGRAENRKTQTLSACSNYDLNPVMYECQRRVEAARQEKRLHADAEMLRVEILTVLNFLDAIAIGIHQGLYIETLAYDHLSGIVARH